MKLVIGIDPSAKKIAAVGFVPDLNMVHTETWDLYGKGETKQTVESLARVFPVVDRLAQWASEIAPKGDWYVWIESPLVGRGGVATTVKQAFVGGILRGGMALAGFHVYDINQATWKAQVIGSGRAEKTAIMAYVRQAWPKVGQLIGNDQDLADAAAINLYGQRSIQSAFPAPVPARRRMPQRR